MIKKIALGFITYNPSNIFLSRLEDTLSLGFNVYIFDNSPEQLLLKNFAKDKLNIKYFTCGKNVGLGYGMATICASAYYDGCQGLLFFDQDTAFTNETLKFVESFYLTNCNLKNSYSAIAFNSKNLQNKTDNADTIKDVDLIINSGTLFFLENLKKIKWHNIHYFVDFVDYEFCLHSKIHRLKIGEYSSTPGFDHVSEQADKKYNILGKSYAMRAYSLNRIFDTTKASLKLITRSFSTGHFKFSLKILRLFFIYFTIQIIVRILNLTIDRKLS